MIHLSSHNSFNPSPSHKRRKGGRGATSPFFYAYFIIPRPSLLGRFLRFGYQVKALIWRSDMSCFPNLPRGHNICVWVGSAHSNRIQALGSLERFKALPPACSISNIAHLHYFLLEEKAAFTVHTATRFGHLLRKTAVSRRCHCQGPLWRDFSTTTEVDAVTVTSKEGRSKSRKCLSRRHLVVLFREHMSG